MFHLDWQWKVWSDVYLPLDQREQLIKNCQNQNKRFNQTVNEIKHENNQFANWFGAILLTCYFEIAINRERSQQSTRLWTFDNMFTGGATSPWGNIFKYFFKFWFELIIIIT